MAIFKYNAVSPDGSPLSGIIEAYNELDAVDRLRQGNVIVNKISQVESSASDSKDLFSSIGKVSPKALSIICSQFSIIIGAGLPIVRTVELIASQASDKALKKILTQVAEDVASGHSLADSFESKAKKLLPVTFIETIRAGEEAGTLDKSFKKLSAYYEKSSKVKSKVASSLAYPAFLILVSVVVVVIIMTVAVPVLSSTFSSMGAQLPLPTRMLIGMSNFLTTSWMYIAGVIIAIIVIMRIWTATEKGHLAMSKFGLKLPIIGKIAFMKCTSQFANTMSTMLTAGLTMVKAVSITGRVLDNYYLGLQVSAAVGWLESGHRLGEYMKKNTEFPELLTEMTSVGEETGSMEHTLDVIGEFYDSEVDTATSRALSLLEPIIVCVLAVFVVFILLAVYLAMFSMYDNL